MKKKKEATFNLDELPEGKLKFVGKGIYALKNGTVVDIYKRHWSVDPKRTLVEIVGFSVLLGVLIGALLWY